MNLLQRLREAMEGFRIAWKTNAPGEVLNAFRVEIDSIRRELNKE